MKQIRPYQLLDHTADLMFRVRGATFPALIKNAIFALTDQIVDADSVVRKSSKKISLKAEGHDLQLIRLLQECLFLFDARGFVTRDAVKIRSTPKKIEATLRGEIFSPERHHPKSEIKAVTLHGLKVIKKGNRWLADVVLDVL